MRDKAGRYKPNHVFTLKELNKLPKDRNQAILQGENFYFNGNLCKYGHLSPRRLSAKCRQCVIEKQRKRPRSAGLDLDQILKKSKIQTRENAKNNGHAYYKSKCIKCKKLELHKTISYRSVCMKCAKKNPKTNTLENNLFIAAKNRARKKNIEFSIHIDDIIIPKICPVFKIKLHLVKDDKSQSHKSRLMVPSLDRISSDKGYIKGNIVVLSYKANIIKGQGSAEQHRKIAEWIRRKTRSLP
tara:strand:- start:525 stop:1250 length:726 start_codon:yes stop_codon:yes gene_type:complete